MMATARNELLLNGRYLTRQPTGVDRFAAELLAALDRRQNRRNIAIAVPSGVPLVAREARVRQTVAPTGRLSGHAWEQIELPRAAQGRGLINLCNTAPMLRANQLVVIHDAATAANAANYTAAFRRWYQLMHAAVMRRSKVVATVSRFSADQLTREYGQRRQGIEVIHEAGEHILSVAPDPAVIERLQLEGRRYVLAVGSQSPNKNFAAVTKALSLLDDPELLLVAVGGGNDRIYAESEATDSRVRAAGYVNDGELRALYEQAACFVFPSFYEGFGLPPLEAMCCGCPVIVSDRASLPEVCGDAALYCRAEDPSTLADALHKLLASAALRSELREAGRAHAAGFGWDRAASHFEEVLNANF